MDAHPSPAPNHRPLDPADPITLAALTTEHLEAHICELAAHSDAAHCRLILLIAEFDRRRAWAGWECHSAAHWLSWKCGISLPTAREHVRVGRALEDLPAVRRAFGKGVLSYSKTRAITRVAEPATEAALVELAAAATASDMERICRAYRQHGQEGAVAAAQQAYANREFRYWYDDDGSLRFSGRLPADVAPVFLEMLAAGRAALKAPVLDEDLTDVPAGASDAHEPRARPVPATGDAGQPRDDGVPAGTRGVDLPEGIGARSADALVLIAETFLATRPRQRAGGERTTINVVVDIETLTTGEDGDCHLANGHHLAAATARRLGCADCTVIPHLMKDGSPLDVGRAQRLLNRAQRRAVQRRDKGCRWPGCTRGGFLEMHHLIHWIDNGPTNLDNIAQLCSHHHHAVHEGGWTIVGKANGQLSFHGPDGRVAVVEPTRIDVRHTVEQQHAALGLAIDAETNASQWENRGCDLDAIIEGLDHLTRLARRREQADNN